MPGARRPLPAQSFLRAGAFLARHAAHEALEWVMRLEEGLPAWPNSGAPARLREGIIALNKDNPGLWFGLKVAKPRDRLDMDSLVIY